MFALAGAGVLAVMLSVLAASGSGTDANRYPTFVTGPDGEPVADEFDFAHQRVTGDLTITARVVTQDDSHEEATAGLMIKDGVRSGSRYAALAVTPGNGIRLQADFTTDRPRPGRRRRLAQADAHRRQGYRALVARTAGTGSRRSCRRTRACRTTVDAGLFVSSPPRRIVERRAGSSSAGDGPTAGRATFDNVSIAGVPPRCGPRR